MPAVLGSPEVVSTRSCPKKRRGVSFRTYRDGIMALRDLKSSEKGDGKEIQRPLAFDGCLVDQHDGNIVLHRVDPVALTALQAFRALPILEGLLAGGTNQNIEQIFGNHDKGIVRQGSGRWSVVGGQWSVVVIGGQWSAVEDISVRISPPWQCKIF
jgi:hypothetical protein